MTAEIFWGRINPGPRQTDRNVADRADRQMEDQINSIAIQIVKYSAPPLSGPPPGLGEDV